MIMIGNVPQGLPTTVTACLFIVAERMGKHNVFVKKLDIIETLGSCTLICTDKTGTLTQNLMSVANTWYMGSKHDIKSFSAQNDEVSDTTQPLIPSIPASKSLSSLTRSSVTRKPLLAWREPSCAP